MSTLSAAIHIQFVHCQNLPFFNYIHCNFCLNRHIIHGDTKENVSGCFFLNTGVYDTWQCNSKRQFSSRLHLWYGAL